MKALHALKPSPPMVPIEAQEAVMGLKTDVPDWPVRLVISEGSWTIEYRSTSTASWQPLSLSDVQYYRNYRLDRRLPFTLNMLAEYIRA